MFYLSKVCGSAIIVCCFIVNNYKSKVIPNIYSYQQTQLTKLVVLIDYLPLFFTYFINMSELFHQAIHAAVSDFKSFKEMFKP